MNRRGFLGSLAALCVAPLVPTPTAATLTRQTGVVYVLTGANEPWEAMIVGKAQTDYRTDYGRIDYRFDYHAERMK